MMSLRHRMNKPVWPTLGQAACVFALAGLICLAALTVLGQEHETGSHKAAHASVRAVVDTEAEEMEEPRHSARARDAEETTASHAEPAAEETAPASAETEPEAKPSAAKAKAENENYEHLPFMNSSQAEAVTEAPSATGLLMRTTGALLLILGLIAATAWIVKKFGTRKETNSPELAVLATLSLGDKQQVSAIRFGNSLLLIGTTAQAITLLAARHRRPRPVPQQARSVGDMLAHQPVNQAVNQPISQPATQSLPFAQELANAAAQPAPAYHDQTRQSAATDLDNESEENDFAQPRFDGGSLGIDMEEFSPIQGLPTMQEQLSQPAYGAPDNNQSGSLSREAA